MTDQKGHHAKYRRSKHHQHNMTGHNSNSRVKIGENARKTIEDLGDDNYTMQLFRGYRNELDDKHERYERIFKSSRDIIIESKRIIFLLHGADVELEDKKVQVLQEAQQRLNTLICTNFKNIAQELDGCDPYLYLKAYTGGLQEFVEAFTFHHYLKNSQIPTWQEIKQNFTYAVPITISAGLNTNEDGETAASGVNSTIIEEGGEEHAVQTKEILLEFPYVDYVLGLADFTGELMRKCVNTLTTGNADDCFKLCNYVKDILTGFLSVHAVGYREVNRKLHVLRQSLSKMELVCYNIRVRGSEIPKHLLVDVINSAEKPEPDEDEGFF